MRLADYKFFFCSFVLTLRQAQGKCTKKQKIKNKDNSTFLSVRKVSKEACTLKRIAKFLFRFAKINKLASLRQNLSFNASLHKIFSRNSFNVPGKRNLFEVGECKSRIVV